MDTISQALTFIKEYGLPTVTAVVFIYLFIKSNKDTLNLVITIKDENNNIQKEQTQAIHSTKDEIKDIIINKLSEIENELNNKIEKSETSINGRIEKIESKMDTLNLLITINKKGDGL